MHNNEIPFVFNPAWPIGDVSPEATVWVYDATKPKEALGYCGRVDVFPQREVNGELIRPCLALEVNHTITIKTDLICWNVPDVVTLIYIRGDRQRIDTFTLDAELSGPAKRTNVLMQRVVEVVKKYDSGNDIKRVMTEKFVEHLRKACPSLVEASAQPEE